jgi:hypothetical protein
MLASQGQSGEQLSALAPAQFLHIEAKTLIRHVQEIWVMLV